MRFAHRLLALALLRRPFSNAPGANGGQGNGTGTGKTPTGGAGGGNPPPNDPPAGGDGGGGEGGDPPKLFSQADIDRILGRERAAAKRKHDAELAALRAQLPQDPAEDPEAGGGAPPPQRPPAAQPPATPDPKSARELARLAKERDEARAKLDAAVKARHEILSDSAVTRALLGLEFIGTDAADSVEASLRGFVKVEEEEGREVVYFVDPKTKTEIAATEREKVAQWIRKRWPSLIKAQGGTGGSHGRGGGGGGANGGAGPVNPGDVFSQDLFR